MRVLLVAAAMLSLSGCFRMRQAKVPPPPGPVPARIPDQVSGEVANTVTLPQPPAVETRLPDGKLEGAVGVETPPVAAARTTRPAARARRAVKPESTPQAPVAESATEPVAPAYRLGELRTPQARETLRRQAEQGLERCAAALAAAEGRTLTPAQTEMLGRVKLFAEQARETMDRDPGEARNLAAKGRTFAEVLLTELK